MPSRTSGRRIRAYSGQDNAGRARCSPRIWVTIMRTLLVVLMLTACTRAPTLNPLERPSGDSAEAMRVRNGVAALSGPAQSRASNWTSLATVWLQLARLDSDQHAMDLSRAATMRALTIDPQYAPALVVQATLEQTAGHYTEARALAERVTRADAKNAAAWGALGDARLALRRVPLKRSGRKPINWRSWPRASPHTRALPHARWLLGDVDGSLALYEAAAL